MAGGRGTRLKPYTDTVPKPLVPITKDRPILDVIISQLVKYGFTHITLAVNHKAESIIEYCGTGSKWGITIDYVRESEPLHTIGPLTLISDLPENFLVMNGDTLTDLDYGAFLREHITSGAPITVSTKRREMKIDFGVLNLDDNDMLTDFTEKPTHIAHVIMGVNAISRSVVESIVKGKWYGFDDLMRDSLAIGRKVKVRPHDGFWIDIGCPEDYRFAVEHFEEIQGLL